MAQASGYKHPNTFARFARWIARTTGRPCTFLAAVLVLVGWGATGPIFHYSDTWQLVINTGTSIVTFLIVFLIQATQNRDAQALQVKLDELIRAVRGARNSLINLDELSDEELEQLHEHFIRLAAQSKRPRPGMKPPAPNGEKNGAVRDAPLKA